MRSTSRRSPRSASRTHRAARSSTARVAEGKTNEGSRPRAEASDQRRASTVSCSIDAASTGPGGQTGTALQSSVTGLDTPTAGASEKPLPDPTQRVEPVRRAPPATDARSIDQHDIQVLTPKRRSHCIVGAANRSQVDPESFPPHGRLSRARARLVLPSIDRMRLTRVIDECRVRTTCWVHVSDLNPALQRTQRRAPPRPRRRNRVAALSARPRGVWISRRATAALAPTPAPRSFCDTAVAPARSVDDSRRPSSRRPGERDSAGSTCARCPAPSCARITPGSFALISAMRR